MKRNFNEWLSTMQDSVASWKYYTDFEKVYYNIEKTKVELNILNSLIGSNDIENEFRKIVENYPKTLQVIPILLAKREKEILIKDASKDFNFNFKNMNYSIDEYIYFMNKTGLFDLLKNHVIHSLVDYVMGIEVGMDTNARKNRTGKAMEDLVESFLAEAGLKKGENYFPQMKKSDVEKKFEIDLSPIKSKEENKEESSEKVFDFVIALNNHIYACEVNFYSSGGSKLNETARSYKELAKEVESIQGFSFVWFTDGKGWNSAKNNLKETFNILDTIYNIKDLKDGCLRKLLTN